MEGPEILTVERAAQIAEIKRENERLRAALEEIVGHADEFNVVITDIAKRALMSRE